jgi:outer membrane protein assembly factor BamB
MSAAAACGGGQTRAHPFDLEWGDEDGSELAKFQRRWHKPVAPERPVVAVGVVDDHTLVGRSFTPERSWRYDHPLEGRPAIAGEVVVGLGGGFLFALDARTGEELWTRRAFGGLRGAGDDGNTTIVSMSTLSGARSVVLAIARDGQVVRQLDERALIGRPAVFDSFAFLPYNRHQVIIFDLVDGTEAARVVSKQPVSHAFLIGDELYFGENHVVRFDAKVVEARRGGGTVVSLPNRALPDQPRWLPPGERPLPARALLEDAVRLYARPKNAVGGPVVSSYVASYFRLAVGLTAPLGRTRWVHQGGEILIGGDAGVDSVGLCDEHGGLRWLDAATGALLASSSLREDVSACVMQSDRAPRRSPRPVPPLVQQFRDAIVIDDPRLLPMQLELLAELAAMGGERASAALVEIAMLERLSGAKARDLGSSGDTLMREATIRLAARRSGPRALHRVLARGLEPLQRRPPVEALATALRAMHYKPAATALARWLGRARSAEEAARVASALERLAGADEIGAVRRFLLWHRCSAEPAALSRAVVSAARTLARLGDRATVELVARHGCDDEGIRQKLLSTLDATRAPVYGGPPSADGRPPRKP